MKELHEIIKRDAENLEKEFEQASMLGKGSPPEIAEHRENAFREFIRRFFPSPYHVTKGIIFDYFSDEPSNSIDCLLLNPDHPNLIDSEGKFKLILADGVDAAIEIKPDLSRSDELIRALKQGVSVKKLRRQKTSLILSSIKKIDEELIELSKRMPYFIFTQKIKQNEEDTMREIDRWYEGNNIPVIERLDGITIMGKGNLNYIKHHKLFSHELGEELSDEEKTGWVFEFWNELSLVGLLINIEFSFKSRPSLTGPILTKYLLKDLEIVVKRYYDL